MSELIYFKIKIPGDGDSNPSDRVKFVSRLLEKCIELGIITQVEFEGYNEVWHFPSIHSLYITNDSKIYITRIQKVLITQPTTHSKIEDVDVYFQEHTYPEILYLDFLNSNKESLECWVKSSDSETVTNGSPDMTQAEIDEALPKQVELEASGRAVTPNSTIHNVTAVITGENNETDLMTMLDATMGNFQDVPDEAKARVAEWFHSKYK